MRDTLHVYKGVKEMESYHISFNFKGTWIKWIRKGTDMYACLAETKNEITEKLGQFGGIYITR